MQYALIIYENEAESYPEGEQGEAWRAVLSAHEAFAGELHERGLLRGGSGLRHSDTATTVRVTGAGRTVHDGPYAETREQLGGFYLIEAADLDEAIAWAKKLPVAANASIEIRPCLDMPQPGQD
jgi:hypothetical protein